MVQPGTVPARVALFHGWAESPVWYRTLDDAGPVDLETLPISDRLRERLLEWNSYADHTLERHGYEWPNTETRAAFIATGSRLAEDLRAELRIEVIYQESLNPPG